MLQYITIVYDNQLELFNKYILKNKPLSTPETSIKWKST